MGREIEWRKVEQRGALHSPVGYKPKVPIRKHMDTKFFWAYRELTNHFKELDEIPRSIFQPTSAFTDRWPRMRPEWGTVFLFDPEAREALDEEIRSRYFPAALKGLQGSRIRVHDRKKVLSQITDLRDHIATRSLAFLLAEPPRPPSGPKAPPWAVRVIIDCSLEICMIGFNLTLSLPSSVNLDSILELMKDDRMGKNPPALSFKSGISGTPEYTLKFLWGRGLFVDMERLITKSVMKHVNIIEAMNQLEGRWDCRELFSDLSAKIIAIYGSDSDLLDTE
jgi:hypothetical protein